MSIHTVDTSTVSTQTRFAERGREVWRGLLIGLIPLGLLAIMVLATVLLTALARLLFTDAGFYAQQQAAVIVLIAGLILSIAAFGLAVWRVLRHVALWQLIEAKARANAALWALGASALVIVVPVLLALLLPQHPYP
jgi:hypothetical protein